MNGKDGAEEGEWGEEGDEKNPSPINYTSADREQKNYDGHL